MTTAMQMPSTESITLSGQYRATAKAFIDVQEKHAIDAKAYRQFAERVAELACIAIERASTSVDGRIPFGAKPAFEAADQIMSHSLSAHRYNRLNTPQNVQARQTTERRLIVAQLAERYAMSDEDVVLLSSII